MLQRFRGDFPGHPTYFEYALEKASAGENDRESTFRIYYTSYRSSPLTFLCKHPKIGFDYYELAAGEYFVSSLFADLAHRAAVPDLSVIAATFLSTKRKKLQQRTTLSFDCEML